MLLFLYHACSIQDGVKGKSPSKPLLMVSTQALILVPNIIESPAYRGESDGLKRLKNLQLMPRIPRMGVRRFPLTILNSQNVKGLVQTFAQSNL